MSSQQIKELLDVSLCADWVKEVMFMDHKFLVEDKDGRWKI